MASGNYQMEMMYCTSCAVPSPAGTIFRVPGVRLLFRRGTNFAERSYNILVIKFANQNGILMACASSVGTAILQDLAD